MEAPRRIFLTGGSGFLGRALRRRLASAEVWAPTRAELDLEKDWSTIRAPFPIDVVVHCAASRDRIDPDAHRWPAEVRINVDATARLYEWARKQGIGALVHVSTISVLEPSSDLSARVDEDAVLDAPLHPYALTKRWAEQLATALGPELAALAIVRPGMIYGPDPPRRSSIARMAASARGEEKRKIAAPRGNLLAPVFVDDVADVIGRLAMAPRNVVLNVAGPDVVDERTILDGLAGHLGTRATFEVDTGVEPVALAPSTARVDALFPTRTRTPWRDGIALAFPVLRKES